MRDILSLPVITPQEEIELAGLIKSGDERARLKFIIGNLRLVVKIAHDYKGLGVPMLDLISEGNMGLIRAVERFDPAKGAKFSSYAAWWIKQGIRKTLLENGKIISTPSTTAAKINKIRVVRLSLTDELDREPTNSEIAEKLDFSVRVVSHLKVADHKIVSIYEKISQKTDGRLKDILPDEKAIPPDQVIDVLESSLRLGRVMKKLDKRENAILSMRFGLDGRRPKTLDEVSKEIGRTRERVRQIQKDALTKLRNLMGNDAPHSLSR